MQSFISIFEINKFLIPATLREAPAPRFSRKQIYKNLTK